MNGLRIALTPQAMAGVDLVALLPLSARDPIEVSDDEDPALRSAMDEALLELVDDPDLIGGATVVELGGDPAARLAALEDAVASFRVE